MNKYGSKLSHELCYKYLKTAFFAGLLARHLVDTIDQSDDDREAAVERAWAAVTALTNMKRPT